MSRSTTELIADLQHAAMTVISEAGGSLPSKEVIDGAGRKVEPKADECRIYESPGNVRWKALLHLQSIGHV